MHYAVGYENFQYVAFGKLNMTTIIHSTNHLDEGRES